MDQFTSPKQNEHYWFKMVHVMSENYFVPNHNRFIYTYSAKRFN